MYAQSQKLLAMGRILLFIALPGVILQLVGCEPEQESTPLAPQGARQQEEPVAAEEEDVIDRDDTGTEELYAANGSVVSVEPANQQVTISHSRVESLGWPEMTMPFRVADPELLEGLEQDMRVEFVFREAPAGNYVIEEIREDGSER